MSRVLVLAGTREARQLCTILMDMDWSVTASLAGVTTAPQDLNAPTRRGGFGGITGFSEWLSRNKPDAVVDATHPFASRMPWNAATACRLTGTPLLRLLRAPWPIQTHWQTVQTLTDAAELLPTNAKVLLTTGSHSWAPFAARTDITCVLRSIEPVAGLPRTIQPLIARPPFDLDSERALLKMLGATHLVSKNAGGLGTAKLTAAHELGIQVIMIRRPNQPAGDQVNTLDDAVAWLCRMVANKS